MACILRKDEIRIFSPNGHANEWWLKGPTGEPVAQPFSHLFLLFLLLVRHEHSDPFGFAQDKVIRRIWRSDLIVNLGTDPSSRTQHDNVIRAFPPASVRHMSECRIEAVTP